MLIFSCKILTSKIKFQLKKKNNLKLLKVIQKFKQLINKNLFNIHCKLNCLNQIINDFRKRKLHLNISNSKNYNKNNLVMFEEYKLWNFN